MNEINVIDDIMDSSEIDVLISIGESYVKTLDILYNSEFDERIIQESCMYMESTGSDDKSSDNKQSIVSYIKNLFSKIFNYVKTAFNKVLNVVKNRFDKNQKYIAASANIFAIADQIINSSSSYSEGYYEEDCNNDDLFQEGLFKTDEEKFANSFTREANKAIKKKNKEEKKTQDQAIKTIEKALNKQFSNEIYNRLLTKNEIQNIARKVTLMVNKDELKILQTELKKMQSSSDMRNISESTKRNYKLIENLKNADIDANREMQKLYQELTIADKSSRHGKLDTEMRVKLVEDFANTMGKTLNKLSNTQHLSEENLKNAIYGNGSLFATVASYFGAVFKRIPEAIKNASHLSTSAADFGKELYESHIDFDDAVFDDEQKRKEYGLRMNNIARTTLFALDQIKEETYGWADDKWFNKQSYAKNNIITSYLGGPCTCIMKILNCLWIGPSALGVGISDIISYACFRKMAKTFNPNGYYRESNRKKAEEAVDIPSTI